MQALIENYRNLPGQHCGSAAMRNLLYHHCGLELPEAVVFGLGSGIESMYVRSEGFFPSEMIFGRSITMEYDAARSLGIDYREQPEFDNAKAWADVKKEVMEGRPAMLTGDIFFLDYRDYKVRFPAHRFVLVGFDDAKQVAWIADRVDPAPQKCSYKALSVSRNPKDGISTFNLWGKFFDTQITRSLEQAARQALKISCGRMLGSDLSQAELLKSVADQSTQVTTGIAGLALFAESVGGWGQRDNAGPLAAYTAQTIETFGSGGANFRNLMTAFFEWCRDIVPDVIDDQIISLSGRCAQTWTKLAAVLGRAAKEPEQQGIWAQASGQAGKIYHMEKALFESLYAKTTQDMT